MPAPFGCEAIDLKTYASSLAGPKKYPSQLVLFFPHFLSSPAPTLIPSPPLHPFSHHPSIFPFPSQLLNPRSLSQFLPFLPSPLRFPFPPFPVPLPLPKFFPTLPSP